MQRRCQTAARARARFTDCDSDLISCSVPVRDLEDIAFRIVAIAVDQRRETLKPCASMSAWRRSGCGSFRPRLKRTSQRRSRCRNSSFSTRNSALVRAHGDARVDEERDLPVDQCFRDPRHVPVWQILHRGWLRPLIRMHEFQGFSSR